MALNTKRHKGDPRKREAFNKKIQNINVNNSHTTNSLRHKTTKSSNV